MVTINGKKIADVGFYINLDERTDRKEIIEKQLKEINIVNVERHSANTSSHTGPLNCELSHRECYQKLLDTPEADTVLVLEDDCLFLEPFISNYETILNDIYNTDWDIFYLGTRNRRTPLYYKNNCFRTSSTAHAHAYILKKKFVEYFFREYPTPMFHNNSIDELLTLLPYGKNVVIDPNKHGFYQMDQPLTSLPLENITSLTYRYCLATQYQSFSSLWRHSNDISTYISSSYYGLENVNS